MLSLRTLALVALLALCFVALTDATSPLQLQRRRPHATSAHAPAAAAPAAMPPQSSSASPQLIRREVGSAARRQQMRADQWSYTMAYHVEPQRPPKPLYEAQYDIEDYHTVMPGASESGYDIEMDDVIQNAMYYAQASTANNNTAWVFDVDETSLSGYTEMLSIGFGYVAKMNHDWILAATAPAIAQTQNLYKQLISQGFKVIFLTGRKDTEHDATATNLVNQGYTQFETLITRTPAQYNMTAQAYKSQVRTMLVEQEGYDIVGCIGDQFSDINGPYTGFKVKLPNYIYYLV